MNVVRHLRRLLPALALLLLASVMAAIPWPAQAHDGHGHVLIYTEAPAGPWHDAAIAEGTPKIQAALEAEGMAVTVVDDSTGVFTPEGLAPYDAIVAFQINGDPWTAEEKTALEQWMAAGNGIAAVHNALDMRGDYAWWDEMVGSLMPGHANTGTDPGQEGVVRVEDDTHPSTEHLTDDRWTRSDEWYNFSNNVRGTAHVLATMDETTYDPGGNAMGYDHPISWCKPYDGGRFWGTAQGHFPSHYDEPDFMAHLVGGVKYVAGLEEGDCGGTVWESYEKVALDENTSAPFAMDIADDGKVFYTELVRGEIRVYDPETQTTATAGTIPVYSGGEDGLLGIALAPDFSETGHLYVYHSPASEDDTDPASFFNRLSRFTYENGSIDNASEEILLEVPARRLPDEPGHTGGGLDFDADGNLYLGVGDDVNPHSEPSGGYAPLSHRDGTFHDARETSANTNDLRGKLLRIHPEPDGSYTIPEGNLFPESEDTGDQTLPEIYAMGFRNPFRFSIDQETGWVSMADYSPDNNNDAPDTRGPAGIAEWNLIKSPGNYGWPLCMGDNEPFRDVDYGTSSSDSPVVGDYFDCANPINDSPRNTGLTELPPARGADMYYGYQRSSVPEVINQGGGLAPMGGPFYSYDPDLDSDTKFPASLDGKPFFYEWARNKMYSIQVSDEAGSREPGDAVEKVNPFLPQEQFLAPIDSKFGPDGSLYVLDWGGGFGRDNPNSGLHRIDYIQGSRSPVAAIDVDQSSGQAPLTVAFDGSGSTDPEGAELTYAWDFTDDGTVDAAEAAASHTYETEGVHTARLTVTDPDGKEGTTTVPITVGNTEPSVSFNLPPRGSFFDFGDEISWDVEVTDPEDTEISGEDVVIQPALGHDEHAHPTQPFSGFTGSTETSLGGHAPDEDIFFAIDARYTDQGDANGENPLTGSATTLVFPKLKEAEFFDRKSPEMSVGAARDIAGGKDALVGENGAWASYAPVNLHRIDQIALRVAAASDTTVELRRGAPDGPLLGTADVPGLGARTYRDVVVDVTDPGETFQLYVVLPDAGVRRLNFLEAIGQGSSPETKPRVTITAPEEGTQLDPDTTVPVTAEATDAENTVTQVEFFVDGESIGVDDTAPFAVDWATPTEENIYELSAVATNDLGLTSTSRIVGAQVGELFGDLVQFTNAGGEFEKVSDGVFRITGAGNNTWQGTDQYSSLFLPGGADDDSWEAVVKVNSQDNTAGAAKAGIMVRNDMAAPGSSGGYAFVGIRPSGGVEFLRDTDGDGGLDASDQGGSSTYPMWVKLARDGDNYTAYYSSNGTSWNQVGGVANLGGPADQQDLGIAMTAHATTAGTVEFEGFAVDSDPDPVDPERTYAPLTCTGPLSDEFDTGLNGKWSVRHATGSPVATADGQLQLPVTTGDINEGSTGPVSFVGQPVPSGDWTATTKLTLEHTSHWQWAGIVVHQSDDEYNKLGFVRNNAGGRFVEFQSETAGSRTTPGAPSVPGDFPSTIHLRLVNTGGTLTAAYSADGESWTDVSGSLELKSDAELGLMAAGDVSDGSAVATADWFRVTPDQEAPEFTPADEFDGELDGCRWAETVRYDADHVSVADGHLKVDTQRGDINGSNPVEPRNFVLQSAPEGDWVATTRFRAPLLHRYQLAGLLMYVDDDNYVKSDVVAYNQPGAGLDLQAELAAEADGSGAGSDRVDIPNSSESGYWYLRVTKEGTTYTAEVSDGGAYSWTPIGEGLTFDQPLTSLGLMAIGPQQEQPVTVEFDYFHLEDAEVDETGPELEVTGVEEDATYGHAAEPELGWTTTPTGSPVTEVVATVDGEEVSEGPLELWRFPLGAHTLEVTATDEDGNSTTVTVPFTTETSYDDVRALVRGFSEDGSITPKLRKDLLKGIDKAESQATSGSSKAAKTLAKVIEDAEAVADAEHREVVVDDLLVLIDDLG